jgi:hypothetical protein
MTLDLTSYEAGLKYHYTSDHVENLAYYDNPFFALIPKDENFGGRAEPMPIIYGNPQGRSGTFSRAQANSRRTSTRIEEFMLTRAKDHTIFAIDNETIKASEKDVDAFMEASTTEMDGAIQSLSNSIASKMYRSGWGEIGRILTSSFATTTLTLTDPEDIVNIEVGMELVTAADNDSGNIKGLGTSGNGLFVTGVNRRAGTFTIGANANDNTDGIPLIAQNDYLFVRGDRQEANTPSRLILTGLEAWLPYGGASATLFFGVDRTVDTRLSGQYLDGTDAPIEEVLNEAIGIVGREGGRLDHFFMPYSKWTDLENSLGSKVNYVDLMANGTIGFRGIQVNGPKGPVKCIADRNCQSNRIWGVQLGVWKLKSLGKAVEVFETDGTQLLRMSDEDGVEGRLHFYGNLGCRAPGWNINIAV